ncbi:endonuclease [Candidatus Bathyarchaeota archaeon RBG_16_57_9]|nr:MAG: endonuclease [Candidatus Bathyarchaeota archaeon RBG_16_57_9]
MLMRLGFHVSIEGGLDRAVDRALGLGCTTFQFFTRSPRMWKHADIDEETASVFRSKLQSSGIRPVFAHIPYLPNLASPREDIYAKSVEFLIVEAGRCRFLGVPYLVTHLGSSLGTGYEAGSLRVVQALREAVNVKAGPTILLENTSGKRNDLGSTFQEMGDIMERVGNLRLGVCMDICHAFARGYDARTEDGLKATLRDFDEVIGLDRLHLIHLNDSMGELGSRIDRHEHIGLGAIGEEGFANILKSELAEKPLIMETPVDERRTDAGNMRKVLELADLHVD